MNGYSWGVNQLGMYGYDMEQSYSSPILPKLNTPHTHTQKKNKHGLVGDWSHIFETIRWMWLISEGMGLMGCEYDTSNKILMSYLNMNGIFGR